MLLGSSQVNIGLRIYLKDEFSGPAALIKNQLEKLRGETKLYQDSLRSARNMYGGLFAAGASAIMGMTSAYQVGAKFDFTMRGVAAASSATNAEFKRMTDQANKLGSTTLFAPQDYGNTMRELALAGLDAREVMSSIIPVMNLAGGAMEDLKTSSEIATNAMYMFGYNKSKLQDWTYVSDILAQGAVKSQISLRDLGESIKYAGSTAQDMGQTLPDITAMIMTLGNAGIKGSMAGTAVENMFRYMALGLGDFAKTGRAQVWEKIGLDPKALVDVRGNLKPMPDILDALFKATQNFGDVDKQNILYEIFGVRGKRAASKLLGGADEYRKHIEELKKSQGIAGTLYKKQADSPWGAIQMMIGSWKALMNQFTATIAPMVTPILKLLAGVMQGLAAILKIPLMGWLVSAGVGLLILKTMWWGVKAAVTGAALAINTVNTSFASSSAAVKMATLDLLNYNRALRGISTMGMNMAGLGSSIGRTAGGTYYARTAAGSRFMPAAEAAALGLALAPGTKAPAPPVGGMAGLKGVLSGKTGLVGKGMGALGIGMGLYQAATGQSTMDKVAGGGMALGAGMSMIPGLAPIGWGLMGLSFVLPLLASATNKNTDATKENTDAQNETLSSQDRLRMAFLSNVDRNGQSSMVRALFKHNVGENNAVDWVLKNNLEAYKQNPKSYGDQPYYDWSNKDRVDIYVHGGIKEGVIEAKLNKQINLALQYE